MPQVQTFSGSINCMAISNNGEIIVAHDHGIYNLTRRSAIAFQPVNAVDISEGDIFTISLEPKLQYRDSVGTVLSEHSLYQNSILPHGNMPPDSDNWHCIYPALNGHFFLCNTGVSPYSGIWRLAEPPNVDGPYKLPQEIHGRRLRGLGWADNHFWIANFSDQIIYKLYLNSGTRRLELANTLHRSLPNSSAILGLAWHGGNLYVAFQVGENTEIHIYESEAEPRKNERR